MGKAIFLDGIFRRPSECPVLRIGEKHLNGVDGSKAALSIETGVLRMIFL
jgi:hypothetical protein